MFRLTATTAIVGLALGPFLSSPGFAQSPPPLAPPAAGTAPAPQTTADPPTQVGRLAHIQGQVSWHGLGADHWEAAGLNFPVASGDSFWTQPGASADLGITNNRMTMDQSTELDITTLDDQNVVATIPQGQIYLRLLALAPGETYTVTTPRGTVAITAPGRYEVAAGDTENPTRVTVVEGAAQVSGDNIDLQVGANQTALITGTDPFQTQLVPIQRDAFLAAQLAREQPPAPTGGVTAPAIVSQMTGGDDLYQYGSWAQAPQYGAVWYPQVAAGYVPYRNGHWAYIAPWGWTWIDDAPWGFAPFHYGRWVLIDGRWAWVPGGGAVAVGAPGYVAPVYAPALVTFFGIGAGVAAGVAIGAGLFGNFANVGWCPLGWQEPYRPWYRASPAYFRSVNVTSVRNVANVTNVTNTRVTINNFANRGAATMVPARAMAESRPINQVARPIPAAQFAHADPVIGRQPIAPTAATLGVTHTMAQQMHLAAPPAGAAARPPAPGPVIRAQAAPTPNVRPPLAAANGAARVGAPPVEHAPAVNGAAVTQHAPGPPIAPRGAAAPGAPPTLRPPTEAVRPEVHAPEPSGAPAAIHMAGPRAEPEAHGLAAPAAQEPHAVPQPHAAEHVAERPVAPEPQAVHQPVPAAHAPAPVVHAAPAPHFAPAPHVAAAPRPAPPPRPAPVAHAAPPPHPEPAPHPQEHRGPERQGANERGPHRA